MYHVYGMYMYCRFIPILGDGARLSDRALQPLLPQGGTRRDPQGGRGSTHAARLFLVHVRRAALSGYVRIEERTSKT